MCDDGVGCENNGSDNAIMTADILATTHGFTPISKPDSITILDYPVNNATITNEGISDIATADTISTSVVEMSPVEYVWDITLNNPADDSDNFLERMFHNPGSGTPAQIIRKDFIVGRGNSFKMYSGGSFVSDPSRFSVDVDDSFPSRSFSGRCAVLINEN